MGDSAQGLARGRPGQCTTWCARLKAAHRKGSQARLESEMKWRCMQEPGQTSIIGQQLLWDVHLIRQVSRSYGHEGHHSVAH